MQALVSDDVKRFHEGLYVVNAHLDSILRIVNHKLNYLESTGCWHSDLPRIKAGGVDLLVMAIYLEPKYIPDQVKERTEEMLTAIKELIQSSEEFELVLSAADLMRIKALGKIGILIAIEGADSIQEIEDLYRLYHQGVRMLSFTWNYGNLLADGVKEKDPGGLTDLGRACLTVMNELGIIVDLSHLAEPGFWDVIKYSKAPVIASHSNARSLASHPRNLTDEQLLAIKATGGVVGLCYEPWFLRDGGKHVSLDDIIRHYQYMAELIGSESLGLGTDFDGIRETPIGMEDISKTPFLTKELLARGISREDVRLVMGENFLRIFQQILD